jgi:hypothetical protein
MKFWKYALVGLALALLFPYAFDLKDEGNPYYHLVGIVAMGVLYAFGTICYNDGKKDRR